MSRKKTSQEPAASSQHLTLFEKILLTTLAIIYEPVSSQFLVNFIGKLDILPGNFEPTKEKLEAALLKLRSAGLLNEYNQCPFPLAEQLMRKAAAGDFFLRIAPLIEREAPVSYSYGKWSTRCWRAMRQFRIGVHSRNFDTMDSALQFLEEHCEEQFPFLPAPTHVLTQPFDSRWLASLPGSLQFFLLEKASRFAMDHLQHVEEIITYLSKGINRSLPPAERLPFHRMTASYLLLQGRFDDLQALLSSRQEAFQGSGFAGSVALLGGDRVSAMRSFTNDLRQLRACTNEDAVFLGITGVFYCLALLQFDQETNQESASRYLETVLARSHNSPEELVFRFLYAVARADKPDMPDMLHLTELLENDGRCFPTLMGSLALYWLNVELPESFIVPLTTFLTQARDTSFLWVQMEISSLLTALGQPLDSAFPDSEELEHRLGCRSICRIARPRDEWKRSLQELLHITSVARESNGQTSRLAWMLEYRNNQVVLNPREQKPGKNGHWSKGRVIALNRLINNRSLSFLSEQDRRLCAAIETAGEQSSRPGGIGLNMEKALPALIGHPYVFLEKSPSTPVEIVSGEPELVVEQQGEYLFIHFTQDIGVGNVALWPETPTRFRVVVIRDAHRRVAAITGRKGLRVPMEAAAQALEAIGNIASFMTVHSSIDVATGQDVALVDADPTIHVHIIPYGSGFRLEMFVQPFSRIGPYQKPGKGVANMMAEVDGRRLQTRRNLRLEEERAREIEESCPMLDLAIDMEQENDREWHMLDPEECLQVLLELETIKDQIVLEWPEGGKLHIRRRAGINQLNLNIRTSQQDWFSLTGHLEIDQDQVIELKILLDKVRQSKSRFIPMGDGQFLALTQEFRNRLEELMVLGDHGTGKDDELRVHALASIALDEITREARITADASWKKRLKSIQNSRDLMPEVPSTLQAELREYQREGFVWMARLAHLGVGCCLADDMGLGKTLQALAVILSLARKGPSLVVAPTSVCMNWEQEISRFAPTLNISSLVGPNRKETVSGLGNFDVLITSYTLLQQEIEPLSEISWQTIVLDEAQSIKNAATKRSQAAMQLNGQFRLITTGTPIENHLGELWNLFRFINPGLLGSFKQFNRRFGIPIEKHHDRDARRTLKKIIRPFMLRRIKSQVLDELPPRTETTYRVEMHAEERRFYEALRQQALENLEGRAQQSGRHLQILAEIMRLRRACCHPRLVVENSPISSSKMEVFAALVEELLGSRHKALIFSQFTGHLALIREFLDARHIHYKYLDGTTPAKERHRQVEAFQSGDGDLFLISLKAGGLGLNLTAADYVIHMDPWWNPAVEDQAADRAHRIGQKRPVTVYRLVTANTIEEKIVRMHQDKRDLANSLLEGSDVSARISAEELLALIRET